MSNPAARNFFMTGVSSFSNRTKSPITMASLSFPANAAHEPRANPGLISTPAIETRRSVIAGVEIKPGLALGSWAAFAGNDYDAMVMGDLVLLENELTPVMKRLRAAGFEITAVHNHVLNESPRVIYMHYMGHGKAIELAKSLHAGLAESKTPLDKPASPAPAGEPPAFAKT